MANAISPIPAGTQKTEFWTLVEKKPFMVLLQTEPAVYLATKGNRNSSPHRVHADTYAGRFRDPNLLEALLKDGFAVEFR